jgi:hypothetical protein
MRHLASHHVETVRRRTLIMEGELARVAEAMESKDLASSVPSVPNNAMSHSTMASAAAREIKRTLPLKMQASKDMSKFLVSGDGS